MPAAVREARNAASTQRNVNNVTQEVEEDSAPKRPDKVVAMTQLGDAKDAFLHALHGSRNLASTEDTVNAGEHERSVDKTECSEWSKLDEGTVIGRVSVLAQEGLKPPSDVMLLDSRANIYVFNNQKWFT